MTNLSLTVREALLEYRKTTAEQQREACRCAIDYCALANDALSRNDGDTAERYEIQALAAVEDARALLNSILETDFTLSTIEEPAPYA